MPNNATRFDEQHGIVRHPTSQGAVVYKLGNRPLVPDELWNHDDLIFQGVSSVSALTDAEIDWHAVLELEGSELGDLLERHWRLISEAKQRLE